MSSGTSEAGREQATSTAQSISEIAWHFGTNGAFAESYRGLSLPDWRILEVIVRDNRCCRECSMQTLIERLGFTKGGITRVVDRLEKRALIERQRLPGDGRVCCCLPTDTGIALAAEISRSLEDRLDTLLSDLPASERTATLQALSLLDRSLSKEL